MSCPFCGGSLSASPRFEAVCEGCRIKSRCDYPAGRGGDACWLWNGARRGNYGVIKLVGGKVCNVHRAAFVVWRGEVPGGASVVHKCTNKLCCNPAHLALKTQALPIGFSETFHVKHPDVSRVV